jgi:hypothetical protein
MKLSRLPQEAEVSLKADKKSKKRELYEFLFRQGHRGHVVVEVQVARCNGMESDRESNK